MKAATLLPPLRRIVRGDESDSMPVAAALRQLDAAAGDPGFAMDAHLRHYLKKRSYGKALEFLENGTEANHGEEA